jgi:putative ABC transport system ATP-binding protein
VKTKEQTMSLVEIRSLEKHYYLGRTMVPALKGVSFSVDRGEFVSIMGPSGCGKTTLLNMIGCIDRPTAGYVGIEGRDVSRLKDAEEADIRLHKIGFIFQSFNLIPVLSVYENIELPMVFSGAPKHKRQEMVMRLAGVVGLTDHLAHKPDELSGGQRQRVAIARALVNEPVLVIADEPTANLDSETSAGILKAMRVLNEKDKVTFIFSTHDPDVTRYAGREIRLRDGLIMEDRVRSSSHTQDQVSRGTEQ